MTNNNEMEREFRKLMWWFVAFLAPFVIALWLGVIYLGVEVWRAIQ